MNRILGTYTAEGYSSTVYEDEKDRVHFMADMDIDVDGSGNSHGDPYFQPDTTLHYRGKALDSDVDKFIVVPPLIVKKTKGIVLGCLAKVTYKGKFCLAVVGDLGPTRKLGEASRAVANALGINPSPISGGVDDPTVLYELWPGLTASIDGRTYELKPS